MSNLFYIDILSNAIRCNNESLSFLRPSESHDQSAMRFFQGALGALLNRAELCNIFTIAKDRLKRTCLNLKGSVLHVEFPWLLKIRINAVFYRPESN